MIDLDYNIADLMINKSMDKNYPEPAGFVKKIAEVTRKEYLSAELTLSAVEEVMRKETRAVEDFKKGKTQVLGYLLGEVQKLLKGKADPKLISDILQKELRK